MIQAVMFITLGFLLASLLGILIAPLLWGRAYRLSRKHLENTLPLSLSDIEASQDQLRAEYAVRLRRLETTLANTKQKTAQQLVENSRLQMQIISLKDNVSELDLKLSERRNAAGVLEQTLTKRVPELEREVALLKSQLQERVHDLQDIANRLVRRDELLEQAERSLQVSQDELFTLRQALEKSGADKSNRRLRRASTWDLDDYKSEYDRLNIELSKMRQQLSQYQDRDKQQVHVIKGELQKLAELILVSAQPKTLEPSVVGIEPAASKRIGASDMKRDRPIPWPGVASISIEPRSNEPSTPVTFATSEDKTDAQKESAVSIPSPVASATPQEANLSVHLNRSAEEKTNLESDTPYKSNDVAKDHSIETASTQPETVAKEEKENAENKKLNLPIVKVRSLSPSPTTKSRLTQDIQPKSTLENNKDKEPNHRIRLEKVNSDPASRESIQSHEESHASPLNKATSGMLETQPAVDKVLSDAKELKALSELMTISPRANGAVNGKKEDDNLGGGIKPASNFEKFGVSEIASEANKGQVLDVKAHTSVQEVKASAKANQVKTLLDRLHSLDDEPTQTEK